MALPRAILPPMGFSASSALRFGWETFKKRPWFFVGAFLLVAIAQAVVEGLSRAVDAPFGGAERSRISRGFDLSRAQHAYQHGGYGLWARRTRQSRNGRAFRALASSPVLEIFRPDDSLCTHYRGGFLLGVALVATLGLETGLAIGIPLLVVLGVIVSLMLIFSGFLVIDRGLGPIEALQESHRITRGYKWSLFGLSLLLLLITLAGPPRFHCRYFRIGTGRFARPHACLSRLVRQAPYRGRRMRRSRLDAAARRQTQEN